MLRCTGPYLSLDQVVALCADVFEEIQDADCAFVLHLLQHAVDHNVCSRAPDSSAEEQKAQSGMNRAQSAIGVSRRFHSLVPAVHQDRSHVCGASC